MKVGLRLQILLLLGGSMLLAFTPLFLAVSTYARFALQQSREASAKTLAHAVAAPLTLAAKTERGAALDQWLKAEVGRESGVQAIGMYGADGTLVGRAGEIPLLDGLGAAIERASEVPELLSVGSGGFTAIVAKSGDVRLALVLREGELAMQAAPLVRLMGLYVGVMALALLLLTYFAMTRLIVRPLGALSQAASRVALGARNFELPEMGNRELTELASSFRTMTERLLAEESALRRKIDEVEKKTQQLKHAQTELIHSERLASAGKLAVGLTHEIGNPIAAIMGLLDLLVEGGLSPTEQTDFLERMRRETVRIHRILHDLLEFARPSSHTGALPMEPGDVESAVYDTIALVNPQKDLTLVEFAVDIFPELPAVRLNRGELTQVFLNLVLNAASAMGQKGRVSISARLEGEQVKVAIEDTGPGVRAELAEQIFEPFMTTKAPGEGTGLGLAICRGLVEARGGRIRLDEGYLAGARFLVYLPRAPRPAEAPTA